MKKLIYIFTIALILGACSDEDKLENIINFEDGFALVDDPTDPVKHERYNIYKEYNVPVYFNDTISSKQIDTDWYGNPVIRYETVDLNWSFDAYNRGVLYQYDYLANQEEQLNTLKFVRQYLEITSKPMRPYSMLIVDTLSIVSGGETIKPDYHVGYRTLVLAQIKDIVDNDTIAQVSKKIIQNMIADKISANLNLCAIFSYISSEKKWYDKRWEALGGCENLVKWHNTTFYLSPSYLFYGPPYKASAFQKDFVDAIMYYNYVSTEEEAIVERTKVKREMGNYGFINCSSILGLDSPRDADADRNSFVQAILYLGADAFTERYGESPLVMKKFTILHDYITTELGVEL